jgi:hypothetical protein
MSMQDLIHIFGMAKENNSNVCIELTVPGREATEFIITVNDNLDYKLKYYKENYNNNLILNRCEAIKIVNAFLLTWPKK